jgi:hypothetical protein
MISKKNIARITGIIFALFGPLATLVIYGFWRKMPIPLIILTSIALTIGFYRTGVWVFVERPDEIKKKVPISSKELSRRTKEFYAWVDSLGRR